jgi:hypothetical protein
MIDQIKTLSFSKNIKMLKFGAFANSSSLTEVKFASGGEVQIDRSAFFNCSKLI